MTPMRRMVQTTVQERYPGLPGPILRPVMTGQGQLCAESRKHQEEGRVNDAGIDLSIVKQEIKQEPNIPEPFLCIGKTIRDIIDLTTDKEKNIYIKVQTNQLLHDVLTHEGEEEDDDFCTEEKVEEISIGSSDEDDPFVRKQLGCSEGWLKIKIAL